MHKSPWRRIAITLSAMLIVLLLAAGVRFIMARGYFASVADKTPGLCRTVDGVSAVTAMARDGSTAIVATPGGLFAFDKGVLTKLAGLAKDFVPVAVSVPLAQDKPTLNLVAARADGTYAVATFSRSQDRVTETSRLSTDQITDPADLVSVNGTQFYLANKHATHTAFGHWLDDVFLLPRAEVLYFDGVKFIPVLGRLNSPSALALSPDGSHLFVGQEGLRNVASLVRNEFIGSLSDATLMSLSGSPRKITVAPDGSLIIAARPKAGTGAVYRVTVANGALQNPELLYSSPAEDVTAAAEAGGHLLIGTKTKLLDCRL